MDIARVQSVIRQMTLTEKVSLLGCGLSLKTVASLERMIMPLKIPDELLFFKPLLLSLGCTFDRELIRSYGQILSLKAKERREVCDGTVNLGVIREPMADGAEYMFAEDPYAVTELARAFIDGAGGVIATNILSGECCATERCMGPRATREVYFKPFETLSGILAGAVIPSGTLNGDVLPSCRGFVEKTARMLKGHPFIINEAGSLESGVLSVLSGASFEIGIGSGAKEEIIKAVINGQLAERRLDTCIERTLMYIAERYEELKAKPPELPSTLNDFDLQAALKSVVMLKNDGTLPLMDDGGVYVAGDIDKAKRDEVSALLGGSVRQNVKDADVMLIFASPKNGKFGGKIKKLVSLAAKSGLRTALIATSVRPFEIGGLLAVNAVLYVPQVFHSTLAAVCALLKGQSSPSGKLPVSWAFHNGDYPASRREESTGDRMYCYESVFSPYRYFKSFNQKLQFPLGFGLSYARFEYTELNLSVTDGFIEIEFSIKNTGLMGADTVAFVFCDMPDAKVYGLNGRLTAFARVSLESGESTKVKLKIEFERLSFYSGKDDAFKVIGGKYTVKIGENVNDIRLTGDIKIPLPEINVSDNLTSYHEIDRFSPSKEEIETLIPHGILKLGRQQADYLKKPSKKTRAKLEQAVTKKLRKALNDKFLKFDSNGISENGLKRLLESD